MSSSTSSLVMALGEASSGGGPQGAGGVQRGGGSLDHVLVYRPLSQAHRVRDAVGVRAAVGDDDRLADAEEDRAAGGVRVEVGSQPSNAPADEKAAERRDGP